MNTPTLKPPSLWLLTALGLLPACGGGSADPDETVGTAHQRWMIVGPKDHGGLSGDGLPFLKWGVRDQLAHCNENTDLPTKFPWCKVGIGAASNETKLTSANHFDNCEFQEATELLNRNYQEAVAACDPVAPDYDKALKLFARVLHASQDFYAHSNWVESGQKGIVDAGADYWTILRPGAAVGNGMTVLEGTQPLNGTSLERSPGSHRVTVTATGGVATLGLMSGVYEDNLGDPKCPTSVMMEHGPGPLDPGKFDPALHLAKDAQNEEWRAPAAELATRQTTHEFCRLRRLVQSTYAARFGGDYGGMARQKLDDAWVADPAAVERACGLSGRFVDKTTEWGLGSVTGTRLSVADINGDNYPDLLVRAANDEESTFQPDGAWPVRVLLNTRKGSFTDVTRSSGLLQSRQLQGTGTLHRNGRASQILAFADIDNDGAIDAFSGSPSYKVGAQWVHPQLLRNTGYGEFAVTTVALTSALSGPNARLFPGSATFFDYDRDGAIDLFLAAQEGTVDAGPSAGWLFHHNTGNEARFSLVSTGTTPGEARGRYRSSLAADLNGDGRPELLAGSLTRHPNQLWRNQGTGFDFTPAPGQIVDPLSGYEADANLSWQDNLSARAFCDYRRLGRVAVARAKTLADCSARTCPGCPCDGDNRQGYTVFRLPTAAEELASCTSDGAGGVPAVPPYPAARAARKFADALRWRHAPSAGLASDRDPRRLAGNTFTTIAADFDGDGKLDLFNATERALIEGLSADPSQVLRNTTPTSPAGGAVGSPISFDRRPQSDSNLELPHPADRDWVEGIQTAAALDADNDSYPDLYIGGADYADNHGHLYRNTSSGIGTVHFDELSEFPVLPRSQGLAVADFDRDGDLDMVIGQSLYNCQENETGCSSTERVRFIQNGDFGSAPPANWLQISLVGDGSSNAAAIGARVSVAFSGRTLVQEVDGGHGHFGAQADQVLHFGLGVLSKVRVTIRWPNAAATVQSWELDANRRYRVVQGEEPTELRIRGYCSDSVEHLNGRVGNGEANEYDDVFCLQDRLSALGFNGKPRPLADPVPNSDCSQPYKAVPQQLAVNGRWTEDTEWALQTFQAAIGQSGNLRANQSGSVRSSPPVTNPGSDPSYQTYVWLGASNAPHWAENPAAGTGWSNTDAQRDNQDWGTSWALDAINQAGSLTTSPFATNDLSFPSGGDTADHAGHEAGRDIDVRNGGNWFAESAGDNTHLGAGNGALWSQPAPDNCARPSGQTLEALIDWLWQQNGAGNSGCIHAVQAAAPGSVPGTFEQGFDALVPLRPGYVRATVAARIRAFLAVQVNDVPLTEKVFFTDPVLRSQVGDDRVRYSSGHSDHFHVSIGVPARVVP